MLQLNAPPTRPTPKPKPRLRKGGKKQKLLVLNGHHQFNIRTIAIARATGTKDDKGEPEFVMVLLDGTELPVIGRAPQGHHGVAAVWMMYPRLSADGTIRGVQLKSVRENLPRYDFEERIILTGVVFINRETHVPEIRVQRDARTVKKGKIPYYVVTPAGLSNFDVRNGGCYEFICSREGNSIKVIQQPEWYTIKKDNQ